MEKSQQAKGMRGEKELSDILRGYGYETKPGGAKTFGAVPDVVGVPGLHIEVKRHERLNLTGAVAQAARDAERFRDGVPAVFHRANRSPWLVTLSLDDFMGVWEKNLKKP